MFSQYWSPRHGAGSAAHSSTSARQGASGSASGFAARDNRAGAGPCGEWPQHGARFAGRPSRPLPEQVGMRDASRHPGGAAAGDQRLCGFPVLPPGSARPCVPPHSGRGETTAVVGGGQPPRARRPTAPPCCGARSGPVWAERQRTGSPGQDVGTRWGWTGGWAGSARGLESARPSGAQGGRLPSAGEWMDPADIGATRPRGA